MYIFSSDVSQMVLIEPVEVKGRGRFPHIVHGLVSGSNNIPLTTITQVMMMIMMIIMMMITQGPREVVKILDWDDTNNFM